MLLTILLSAPQPTASLRKPTLLWHTQIGTAASDVANAIAADRRGHVVIAGHTREGLDPGQWQGGNDAFVAKFDAQGREVWRTQIGTRLEDLAFGIATDHQGHVVITGHTTGELDPGEKHGSYDAFVAKFDSRGTEIWRTQIGSGPDDRAYGIATDHLGHIAITGATTGEIEPGQAHGHYDAFVAKFDSQGNELWRTQVGTGVEDQAYGIATDHLGHIVITGATIEEKEPGQADDGLDVFVARLDPQGTEVWRTQIGTGDQDMATGIATDHLGHVVVTGYTTGELKAGQKHGSYDAFVAKFDPQGTEIWRTQIGTEATDVATGIATDRLGHVVITGHTMGQLDPGQARGSYDAFMAKFDPQGREVWRTQIGTVARDIANGIATDHLGHVVITGQTMGELDLGQAHGGGDAFVAKFIDDLSPTHHHLLIEDQMRQLHQRLVQLELGQLPLDLDLAVLQAANERTRGRAGGQITKAEAREILRVAQDEKQNISVIRRKTLAFVFARYPLTRGASELIAQALV